MGIKKMDGDEPICLLMLEINLNSVFISNCSRQNHHQVSTVMTVWLTAAE
jgi:NADH:ubiquinone oxidoreductase subunit K